MFGDKTEKSWSPQTRARLKRVRLLSRLLDEQLRIPGTMYRVGLDGLLGLIPGVGDVAGALLSKILLGTLPFRAEGKGGCPVPGAIPAREASFFHAPHIVEVTNKLLYF